MANPPLSAHRSSVTGPVRKVPSLHRPVAPAGSVWFTATFCSGCASARNARGGGAGRSMGGGVKTASGSRRNATSGGGLPGAGGSTIATVGVSWRDGTSARRILAGGGALAGGGRIAKPVSIRARGGVARVGNRAGADALVSCCANGRTLSPPWPGRPCAPALWALAIDSVVMTIISARGDGTCLMGSPIWNSCTSCNSHS